MEKKVILTSERLLFSEWQEGDQKIADELWGDLDVTKLIDARGQLSAEQVRQRLRQELDCLQQHGVQYWPIYLLTTDEHVGCCGLRPYDLDRGIYELGVHIKKKFWGQGLAFEGCSAVIEYAFNKLNVNSLFAGHNPNNNASKKLLEKLGFRFTHKELYPPTGLEHPSYLLKKEN